MGWFSSLIPNVLSTIGSTIGSWFGYKSAVDRNQAQQAAAREQMSYQERMSSTAHQREVADLKAAGLNPILSAKYGGASTPPGAMPNLVKTIEGVQSGTSSAMSALATRLTGTQIGNVKATTRKEAASAKMLESEAEYVTKNADAIFSAKYFGTATKSLRQVLSETGRKINFRRFGSGIGKRFWKYYYRDGLRPFDVIKRGGK